MKSILTNNRAQVGIGTLIVFIAMVLVAAIASGVLINTAEMLQTQSEATGEESTSQVADRLRIQTTTGEIAALDPDRPGSVATIGDLSGTENTDGNKTVVYVINMTVSKAPGAGDINLANVTTEVITDSGVAISSVGVGEDDVVQVSPVTNTADETVITDKKDQYILSFASYVTSAQQPVFTTESVSGSPWSADFHGAIPGNVTAGDSLTIRLTSASGATTMEEVRVPSSLVNREEVLL